MLIKDLQDHLGPTEYAALRSIEGFDQLDPYIHIAGLTENGNYHILYLPDGSKLRFTPEDSLDPDRPECIDCTITKRCDGDCRFCYMNCTTEGEHAPLREGRALELMEQIEPYTELAINGNDLSHPDLDWFLRHMAARNVFVNITVNQQHFVRHFDRIVNWKAHNMVRGIGVSYTGMNSPGFIGKLVAGGTSLVVHTIAGLLTKEEWDFLSGNNLSLLILGYKDIGRGVQYRDRFKGRVEKRMKELEDVLVDAYYKHEVGFRSIAFDGLALEQLHVKEWFPEDEFNQAYAGGEGAYTFYLDLVDQTYARSSIESEMMPCENLSINEMFQSIRTEPLGVPTNTIKPIRRRKHGQDGTDQRQDGEALQKGEGSGREVS